MYFTLLVSAYLSFTDALFFIEKLLTCHASYKDMKDCA